MGHKNKKRYQSKGNQYPTIKLTGRCFLLHHHHEYENSLQAGDVMFYMYSDSSLRDRDNPGYEKTGGCGYIKADIYDGTSWHKLVMDDIFPDREHHFSKTERPLDTYLLCAEKIALMRGEVMQRGYRSHYEPVPTRHIDDTK